MLEGKNYLTMVRQFLEATVAHSMRSRSAGLSEEEAISSAANSDIETFRRKFVAAEENAMFDQMVAWTITRAFAEMSK